MAAAVHELEDIFAEVALAVEEAECCSCVWGLLAVPFC